MAKSSSSSKPRDEVKAGKPLDAASDELLSQRATGAGVGDFVDDVKTLPFATLFPRRAQRKVFEKPGRLAHSGGEF